MFTYIITNVYRPSTLLANLEASMILHLPVKYLIGTQSYSIDLHSKILSLATRYNADVTVVSLPFDCGISHSRNRLVELCQTEYCIIGADSIVLTGIPPHIPTGYDLIGLGLANQKPWVKDFTSTNTAIKAPGFSVYDGHLHEATHDFYWRGYYYLNCDLCLNFLYSTTEFFKNHKWDENFKCGEHRDWFLSLYHGSNRPRIAYNTFDFGIKAVHPKETEDSSYRHLRSREWLTYIPLAKKKWGGRWVE